DTPDPAETAQSMATSPIERPAAVRAVAVNFTTSPVRTVEVPGSMATRTMLFGSTCRVRVSVAGPAVAVIVARPAATARSRPSFATVATRGLLEANGTGSERLSPCRENGVAESVSRELELAADGHLGTAGLDFDFGDLLL